METKNKTQCQNFNFLSLLMSLGSKKTNKQKKTGEGQATVYATPTDLTLEAVLLRVEEWKRLTGARGPSPEPLLPAPTRAAHSPVQKGAHLTAAHLVNESSPVMDCLLLQLAVAERPAGSRDSALRSSHPRRGRGGVVAHNASNFLRSAATHAFLSSDVLPLQNLPLSSVSAPRSRVRLQTHFVKPCPLV